MRYKATRSLHYITEDGESRIVAAGDYVTNASQGVLDSMVADGFAEAVKAAPKNKEGE